MNETENECREAFASLVELRGLELSEEATEQCIETLVTMVERIGVTPVEAARALISILTSGNKSK